MFNKEEYKIYFNGQDWTCEIWKDNIKLLSCDASYPEYALENAINEWSKNNIGG